jgi:hypothetical protein
MTVNRETEQCQCIDDQQRRVGESSKRNIIHFRKCQGAAEQRFYDTPELLLRNNTSDTMPGGIIRSPSRYCDQCCLFSAV